MWTDCNDENCEGDVPVGWHLDGELSQCDSCGHVYRVWGDETYVEASEDAYEWWTLTEPDEPNPW